ncbi:MAG TPA: hypothetical protein VJ697_02540, partial [Nitrososphaeraceae archaeon]|nr:hypothetical protein [Nitrososphaeraceae archaeon]
KDQTIILVIIKLGIDKIIQKKISISSKGKSVVVDIIIYGLRYISNKYARPNVTKDNTTVSMIIIDTFNICPI